MTIAEMLLVAAVLILVVAAVFDLVTMEIPDTLPIALLAIVSAYWIATPGPGIWSPVAAFGTMLAIGLFLFARGWMGGGDIKLLVALAPLPGLQGLPLLLAVIAIAGGLLAVVMMTVRSGLHRRATDPMSLPQVLRRDAPLPYAVAIACGAGFWAWRMGLFPG
ncbi:MAG: prepilin peptidase [Thermaurantiacus sp.]